MTSNTKRQAAVKGSQEVTRMTKRQKMNLVLGLSFLVAGIAVFAILRMMEGSIVLKDGQELVYTVDPYVYGVMAIITIVGVLIIAFTLAEHRRQSRRTGKVKGLSDPIDRKKGTPTQKKTGTVKGRGPDPKQRTGKAQKKGALAKKADVPMKGGVTEQAKRKRLEPAKPKEPDVVLIKKQQTIQAETEESVAIKEPRPTELALSESTTKVEPETITNGVTETTKTRMIDPAIIAAPEPTQDPGPARPERYLPVKVEALGRCPVCGKVIVVGQTECFKCGWKVQPENLAGFDRKT
jgi:hypothetical protein